MRKNIEAIVAFFETDEVPPALVAACQELGHETLRLLSINILGWLASGLFVPRGRKITFHNRPPWFPKLEWLIDQVDGLNDLFVCEKYSLDFRKEIETEERLAIHHYVIERYKPRLFIK
jgi:hypothetical protein